MRLKIVLCSGLLLMSHVDSTLADSPKFPVLTISCVNANTASGAATGDVTKFYSTDDVAISPPVQFDVTRGTLGRGAVRVDPQNPGVCTVKLKKPDSGNPRFELTGGHAVMRGQNGSSGTSVAPPEVSPDELRFMVTTRDFFLGHTVAIYEFEIRYKTR